MKIRDFGVEKWMNEYEVNAKYNIAETCVSSITIDKLLSFNTNKNKEEIIADILSMKMDYGAIEGSNKLRQEVCNLFSNRNLMIDNVSITHGGAGANHLVYESLICENDHVIVFLPTYQQHYSIPEALKANVSIIKTDFNNNFEIEIDILKNTIRKNTKAICLNNPNNPTGTLISDKILKEIVSVAKEIDAYIICDEVYRGLHHELGFTTSIVDLYDKGISTGSLSKVFSLAGLRIGWIVGPKDFIDIVNTHRDYSIISCSKVDDYLATIALENKEQILKRSNNIINENIEILDNWIKSVPSLSYVKPVAGTTALVKYNLNIDSVSLCHDLYEKTGVMVVPGSVMDMEGFIRIGYANDKDILEKGLAIFKDYLEKY